MMDIFFKLIFNILKSYICFITIYNFYQKEWCDDELFCDMVDRWKAFSLITSLNHCQRSSLSRMSDMTQAEFEPAQNLSSGLVKWSCAVALTTTPRRHKIHQIKELRANLHDKKEYVIYIINLKQTLNHGLVFQKVHRCIKLNQKPWFKPYINMNTELGKKAKTILKKIF